MRIKLEKIILVEDKIVIATQTDLVEIFRGYFDKNIENLHTKFDIDSDPVIMELKTFRQIQTY